MIGRPPRGGEGGPAPEARDGAEPEHLRVRARRSQRRWDPPSTQVLWLLLALTGAVFVWSRTAGLTLSLYHDEVFTVTRYVHDGPHAIFFGRYEPNNHPLFSLVTWATWLFAGDSELVFRFWSIVPSVAVAVLFVWWLWRRYGATPAVVVAILVTTSPLLGSLSVLARGYGLAMLGIGVAVMAGIEAGDDGRRSMIALSITGSVIAVLSLPLLGLTAVGVVLGLIFAIPDRRRTIVLYGIIAGAVCLAWYAPLLDDIIRSSGQEFGTPLPWHGPVTGPLAQLFFPTLRMFSRGSSTVSMVHPADPWVSRLIWYSVSGAIVAIGLYRLFRDDRRTLALLAVPVLTTFIGLTAGRFFVEPRFVSPLFLPVALLAGMGVRETLDICKGWSRSALMTVWASVWIALLLAVLPAFQEMTGQPIEAFEPVGRMVETLDGPVVTNSRRPTGLQYYIEREIEVRTADELEGALCAREQAFVFIEHPLLADPVDTSCLRERNAHRTRFLQRDRGNHIDVWDVPAAAG